MDRSLVLWSVIGVVGVTFIAVIAVYFQNYLATRVIGPSGVRVAIRQGQTVTVQINTSSAPSVKVELCQENSKPEKCQTLAARATGKQIAVRIPATYPIGKAIIKVVERDRVGNITGRVQYRRAVLVAKGLSPTQSSATSGGSGGESSSGGGGDNGGGGDSTSNVSNTSPPLVDEFESDGRKITIRSNHSELMAGQTERITVTYAVNHWPGTYKGRMEVFVQSPDISNISPGVDDRRFYDGNEGRTYLVWSYSIPNGQSASFTFDVKVPPKGYKGRDSMEVHAQMIDTYGPQYLNQDGTAPEGPLNVSRANAATWPIR